MPGKIVHIALKVKDLESSTRFYEDVFGFRQVTTHRGKDSGHVSRHLTDGAIDLALMVYDSEDAPEARLSGIGPCIHHWGAEVDDITLAAEKIKELGGEVMSPLDAGVIKFRAPDGTIAELVQKDRYENLKKYHSAVRRPCSNSGAAVHLHRELRGSGNGATRKASRYCWRAWASPAARACSKSVAAPAP